MKAQELRIGNWIDTIEGFAQIKAISEEGLMTTSIMDGGDLLGWATPIPLTEEWLNRFGFREYDANSGIYYDGNFEYEIVNNSPFWIFNSHNEVDGSTWRLCKTQYVHQLQNLYFALTGEELTYA